IRAGGPAIGFQTVSAQMYVDQGITLGQVNTDEAVSLSATQPTVAVVAPLDISPQMLMWDPAVHPNWHTIADVGRSNTRVLYYQTATFMQYLIGAGILHQSQVDGSYDGSPANFVASGGSIAQQGFATNEPYLYAKALPQWDKPVAFQLINDTGYPMYSEPLTVRASQEKALSPCLSKLVPIIQKSEVDYLKSPQATNNLIVTLAAKYSLGQTYTASEAQFSTEQQLKLHIASNQPGTKTLGGFDPARIQRIISILTPILSRQGKQTKAGLTPPDIATSEFVDPNIGLSS
ncbi:MAG TPA: ABC transporter substrate-binding protein, partial [Pseudonocardiaceae bacterium]|nr:ABC transporter substrate-binding protein [Pseudonocardiaceae bacterium]